MVRLWATLTRMEAAVHGQSFLWLHAVIATAMLLSLLLDFAGLDPIKALVLSAAINGIVAVPILLLLIVVNRHSRIVGQFRISTLYSLVAWMTVAFMALVAVGLLIRSRSIEQRLGSASLAVI
jgi:Mn2+/Fe2+ NRAMP family transporter